MSLTTKLFQEFFEGKIDLVKKRLDIILRKRKDDPWLWFLKALIEVKSKSYNEALEAVEEAIGLKKEFYEAWVLRGVILRNLEHFDDALFSFDQAIKLRMIEDNYEDYEIKIEKAKTYIKMGDKKRAKSIVDEILLINPEDDELKSLLEALY